MTSNHHEPSEPAIVWLDRPASRNALRPGDLDRLVNEAIEHAKAGRAIVVAGRGESFCAGFDLKQCAASPGVLESLLRELSSAIAAISGLEVPVVIAARGAAIAGGCALLSAADAVVTHRSAKLGYPVVRLGLSPGVSAPYMRTTLLGGATRRLQLDPGLIDGEQALRLGLVSHCVGDPEAVLEHAMSIARELAGKPRLAFAATKSWVRELSSALSDAPDRGLDVSLATARGDECVSRLAAL